MKKIDIIGVPLDIGASKRGVDMGPSAIRYTNLYDSLTEIDLVFEDLGNINVPVGDTIQKTEIINSVNKSLFELVKKSLNNHHFPFILGGDHSLSIGSTLAVQSKLKNIGVMWVDTHGDFNDFETSPSGNIHGMSLSVITGFGPYQLVEFISEKVRFINPKNVVIIGAKEIDKKEAQKLKNSGITVFTISDIDRLGISEVTLQSLEIVQKETNGFHLSFDLDAITPSEAPGVGTPSVGGLTFREAHTLAELVSSSSKLVSAEIVELNPIFDIKNQTGELAKTLICSILGKKIM